MIKTTKIILDPEKFSKQEIIGENIWQRAQDQLDKWANELDAKIPGYCKVDFTIVYADENVYEGRIDVKNFMSDSYVGMGNNLSLHVLQFMKFASGEGKPRQMTQEQYEMVLNRAAEKNSAEHRKFARDFHLNYEVGQI